MERTNERKQFLADIFTTALEGGIDYKIWEEKAISEYTCEFGREWIRDIYTLPCGIKIYLESYIPRNIFGKQRNNILVDIIYHKDCLNHLSKVGVDKNIIFFDENRYTEENFGYIVFTDYNLCSNKNEKIDLMEIVYNFCESGNARKLLEL